VAAVIEDVVRDLKAKGSEAFPSAFQLNRALVEKNTYGYVGIEFEDTFSGIKVLPDKVTVALRFPLHLITNPKLTWDDRAICKHSDMDTDYYLEEGFLAVQAKLSEALIRAKNESAILPEVMAIFRSFSSLQAATLIRPSFLFPFPVSGVLRV